MRGVIAEDARKRVKSSDIYQVEKRKKSKNCVSAGSICQTQPLETMDINNSICCETLNAAPISKSGVGNCISKIKLGQSLELNDWQAERRIIGLIDTTTTTSDSLTEFVFSSTFSENYSKDFYAHEDIWEIPENLLEAIPTDLLLNSNNVPNESQILEDNIPTQ